MSLSEMVATEEKLFVNSYARKLHHGKEQKYCLPISGQPSLYELCGVGFLTEAVWHNTRGVDRKFLLKFFRHLRQKTLNDFCTTHPVRQSSHNLKIGWISHNLQHCHNHHYHCYHHQHRVAKCHRYGRYIYVNFLEVWGQILEFNIRASDVG